MKRGYLWARSVLFWCISLVHFGVGVPFIVACKAVLGARRIDPILRFGCRNVVRFAGAKLKVHYAPGFDPKMTCFFVSNHVNMFDPFVAYSALPQLFRGLELESHFKVPFYGWLMKSFGNVPVGDGHTTAEIKKTFRLAKQRLEEGVSLMVYPEGGRTLDGHVAPFSDGVFSMARLFRCPIVPISVVGAFEFKRKDHWMLRPATVNVYVHDAIAAEELRRSDPKELRDRVHRIVSEPVEAQLRKHYPSTKSC